MSHTAAVYKGKVYVIGGIGPAGSKLQRKCEVYDPAAGNWVETWGIRSGRFNFPSVSIDPTDPTLNNNNNTTTITTTTTTTTTPTTTPTTTTTTRQKRKSVD